MYFYRVYWANVILGGVCTFAYAMTIPIYFNLGGEITFPTGEAHSTALNAFTMNMVGLILVEFVKDSFTDSCILQWSSDLRFSQLTVSLRPRPSTFISLDHPLDLILISSWNSMKDNIWPKWIHMDGSFSRKLFVGRNDFIYHGERRFKANACEQSCSGHNFRHVFETFELTIFFIWLKICFFIQMSLHWYVYEFIELKNICIWSIKNEAFWRKHCVTWCSLSWHLNT